MVEKLESLLEFIQGRENKCTTFSMMKLNIVEKLIIKQ